jgi:anaerobic ribonucleoside-triphosphate reductase
MNKVMKLTENDLKRIITKILKEDDEFEYDLEDYKEADEYANRLFEEIDEAIYYNLISCLESMNLGGMVREAQSMFKDRYPEYASTHESIGNEHITSLMSMSQNPDLENVVSWMINGMDDGDVLIVDKK